MSGGARRSGHTRTGARSAAARCHAHHRGCATADLPDLWEADWHAHLAAVEAFFGTHPRLIRVDLDRDTPADPPARRDPSPARALRDAIEAVACLSIWSPEAAEGYAAVGLDDYFAAYVRQRTANPSFGRPASPRTLRV